MKIKQFNQDDSLTTSGTIHIGIEQYHSQCNNKNFKPYITINNVTNDYQLNECDILEFRENLATSSEITVTAEEWFPDSLVTIAYEL